MFQSEIINVGKETTNKDNESNKAANNRYARTNKYLKHIYHNK